jgi:hypothetical protein
MYPRLLYFSVSLFESDSLSLPLHTRGNAKRQDFAFRVFVLFSPNAVSLVLSLQVYCAMTADLPLTLGIPAFSSAAQSAVRRVAKRKKAKRGETHKAPNATKHAPKRPLRPSRIFGNERRTAIIEVMRATGEKITGTRIRKRIAALWYAETDKPKYFALAHKDKERYADEKAAFDWNESCTRSRRAASSEDATETLPPHDAAACASVSGAAASVYSFAVSYLQPFLVCVNGSWVDPKMLRNQRTQWAAMQLMAAGRGPLRAPTCNHTLRVASGGTAVGRTSLRRALLLVRPGELQELHELRTPLDDAETCLFIVSMLRQERAGSWLENDGAFVSTALASLRVIRAENVQLPAALIQQCTATLTELNCSSLTRDADCVVPACARLESLTLLSWWSCPPAAWLGLSQLHTLRGVSLSAVPAAAIAAALPRLHTLHLKHDVARFDFSVDAFYEDLLPRLRSFGLKGSWPETSDQTATADVLQLPLLEDLTWRGWEANHLPRRFMGARPSQLDVSYEDVAVWLNVVPWTDPDSPPAVTSPFARVRQLTIRLGVRTPERPLMALVLRAAPQLRHFTFDVFRTLWRNALDLFSGPHFALRRSCPLLVHLQLRHVAIKSEDSPLDVPVPGGCGVRLRRRHFPRLRRLTVGQEEYPVWTPNRVRAGRRRTFAISTGNDS